MREEIFLIQAFGSPKPYAVRCVIYFYSISPSRFFKEYFLMKWRLNIVGYLKTDPIKICCSLMRAVIDYSRNISLRSPIRRLLMGISADIPLCKYTNKLIDVKFVVPFFFIFYSSVRAGNARFFAFVFLNQVFPFPLILRTFVFFIRLCIYLFIYSTFGALIVCSSLSLANPLT